MIVMITNTIVPYCYDIAHVLGLPTNFAHRFRYRSRWIRLPYDVVQSKCRDALIVLRNFATAQLVPVRFARVQNVLSMGEIHYVEFRLGHYCPSELQNQIAGLIAQALVGLDSANLAGNDLEALFLDVDNLVLPQAAGLQRAQGHELVAHILRTIGSAECYKDFSFLRILHIRDSIGKYAQSIQEESGGHAFSLRPSRVYFLDVVQHVPWKIEEREAIDAPYDVELKTESDEVIILRKTQRVVGKYDLLRFIFKTPSGYTVKNTFLEVVNRQAGEAAKYGLPALFLPIRIQAPLWIRLVLGCRVAMGALAIVAVVASEPLARILGLGAEWVRDLALLFAFVLAAPRWEEFVVGFVKGARERAAG